MSEILKKIKFADIEEANELKDDACFPVIQNGETFKINKQKVAVGGKSAYDIAVENGYTGTEEQWLNSLKGAKGTTVTLGSTTTGEAGTEAKVQANKYYVGSRLDELELLFTIPRGDKGDGYILTDEDKQDIANMISGNSKKYGFIIDTNSLSPKLTRIGDARYLVAETSTENENVRNDFDDIFPFSEIRRCNLADDGSVNAYEGEPGYTVDGSNGQVMVEIPKYYRQVYISESTGQEYRWFCKDKLNEYYSVPKAFLDVNGNELDYIYIGAYMMSTDIETGTIGQSQCYNGTYNCIESFSNSRQYASARGTNWHMLDIWEYDVIKDLFMLEWGTTDSQSKYYGNTDNRNIQNTCYGNEAAIIAELIGEENIPTATVDGIIYSYDDFNVNDFVSFEVSNGNTSEYDYTETDGVKYAVRRIYKKDIYKFDFVNDGVTENIEINRYYIEGSIVETSGIFTGTVDNSALIGMTNSIYTSSGQMAGDENYQPFVWRGLENIYGTNYTWIDGILLGNNEDERNYYVCQNPNKYTNDVDENYITLSCKFPDKNGYISKMEYDEVTGLSLPTEAEGSSNTAYCDYINKPISKTALCSCRMGGSSGLQGGLFNLSCNSTAPSTYGASARLSYRHYE